MMLFALMLIAAQERAGPPAPTPSNTSKARYDACIDLATGDPVQGEADATAWRSNGGAYFARQCLGIALANQGRWQPAAQAFEGAAADAEAARDTRAAQYWAQAGNAWLANGQALAARKALDAALAAGTLTGLMKGEALFDRGRALVLLGELPAARTDIDEALDQAPADPLIWLASATLARKMGNLPRARADIAEAFKRSPDDASVHLEIGNIAAMAGDEAGAKAAWSDAARLAPTGTAGISARAALAQFGSPKLPETR